MEFLEFKPSKGYWTRAGHSYVVGWLADRLASEFFSGSNKKARILGYLHDVLEDVSDIPKWLRDKFGEELELVDIYLTEREAKNKLERKMNLLRRIRRIRDAGEPVGWALFFVFVADLAHQIFRVPETLAVRETPWPFTGRLKWMRKIANIGINMNEGERKILKRALEILEEKENYIKKLERISDAEFSEILFRF